MKSMLICIIYVLMHHKMFEILKTAIAITTQRQKCILVSVSSS